MASATSLPLRRGRPQSSKTRAGRWERTRSTASRPSAAVSTVKPSSRRASSMVVRSWGSSSTTRIRVSLSGAVGGSCVARAWTVLRRWWGCVRAGEWQAHGEGAAASDGALDVHGAAMQLDDLVGAGQADAGAADALVDVGGAVELLEDQR